MVYNGIMGLTQEIFKGIVQLTTKKIDGYVDRYLIKK